MSKESATYQQLQRTIVKPGCPICGLCQQAVHTYLDTLLWESSTDANFQELVAASLGFCGRHSRQLLSFGGQRLAAAVVERLSLLAALRRLPALAASPAEPPSRWSRFTRRRARGQALADALELMGTVEPCPACVRERTEASRGAQMLLAHFDEFAGPLRTAGGLCLPHFVLAAQTADAQRRAALLTIQQTVWTELSEHLEEFIRKHMEHHHTDPISEPARLALERTIAGLTGEYPVR